MNANNPQLDLTIQALIECFQSGGKLLVCGNGGSSADSAHIVGELVKGFLKRRPLPEGWSKAMEHKPLQMGLPAIDLSAQASVISAVVNDLGGELMYAQQVMAYGQAGDMLIGITTSGNAENVCMAMRAARLKAMTCVGLTGRGGGKLKALCDIWIEAPESETYLVQETHIRYYHELCARVEEAFFAE